MSGAILSMQSYSFSILWKTLAISGIVLYSIIVFLLNQSSCPAYELFSQEGAKQQQQPELKGLPTNITHIMFGLVGSVKAWKHRIAYTQSWWHPNVTRGYLFLDEPPTEDLLPWSSASPPFRISENISLFLQDCKHSAPVAARIMHAILEVLREEHDGVRWLVMGDDDSIFFLENMVHFLSMYNHNELIYIGGQSETILSDYVHSFDMGFGGAGLILSYPLAKLVASDMKNCLRRYAYLRAADLTLMSCIADFGISFTAHKGIHQIDLRGDISGFLSSHPQAPLLSLHHFDKVDPIFPNKSRAKSGSHLMKAAKGDQSRLLQQTICYHRPTNWSFSISWGYSVHVYENVIPRSILKKPLETFTPWSKKASPPLTFIFNTRLPSNDSCEAPHLFFFDGSLLHNFSSGNQIVTNYVRARPRLLPPCSASGGHSADYISEIQVFSPSKKLVKYVKSECCDIELVAGADIARAKFRACLKEELIA